MKKMKIHYMKRCQEKKVRFNYIKKNKYVYIKITLIKE